MNSNTNQILEELAVIFYQAAKSKLDNILAALSLMAPYYPMTTVVSLLRIVRRNS